MKTIVIITVATILTFVMGATKPTWADSDEARVRQVILGVADAVTAFPQSKDYQSVLRFFAEDFSSIDDVERGSIQNLERTLTELERDLTNDVLTITEHVSDIVVHVLGTMAWATYDDALTLAQRHGTVKDQALCTAIFRKTDAGWVYTHKHCSSYATQPGTDLQDSSKLTRSESGLKKGDSWRLLRCVRGRFEDL